MGLKFLALSGTTNVTENLYVYEYGNDMIIVDCGVGFPEQEMYGVDLVIPDFSYIRANKEKLRGVVISHGHEDHLGAIPFLLKEVNAPIYSTKLVNGFIQDKLSEYKIPNAQLKVFDPEKDVLSLGVFKITPFRVSHSVPDGVGFCIDTPEGKIFHVADFKFDWTPVDGKPFDVGKAAILASDGVLALACDCLGSTNPGYTESEKQIEKRIEHIVGDAKGKIYFTTISSNISRIKQALMAAEKAGRKACFIGRSIDSKSTIANNLGYLEYPRELVITPKEAAKYPKNKILFIISGCYGQPGSALYRVALGEHEFLTVDPGDLVVFSADPAPPGSKANVDFVVDKLIESNIDVHYYDMQEDLHVSGHGSQEDIKMMMALAKPKFYIPIGGTIRHMRAYSLLAEGLGAKAQDVIKLGAGDVVEFSGGNYRFGQKVSVKDILVDGLGIGDVGNIILRDRHVMAKEGVAIVLIQYDKNTNALVDDPEIISRGFVFGGKKNDILNTAGQRLREQLERRKKIDKHTLRDDAINFLDRLFFKETGRRPMVLPVVVEV
jgi:ribonuclease J